MTAQVISNTLDKSGLAHATLPSGAGKGAETHNILTDGVMFYCAHDNAPDCTFVRPNFYQVFGHLAVHGKNRAGVRKVRMAQKRATQAGLIEDRLTVLQAQALAVAESVEEIRSSLGENSKAEAEHWKERARKAERDLRAIRRAFSGLAGE